MRRTGRIVGLGITCFGLGILLTFFLPISMLIIIEAIVIILAGVIFISC